MLRKSISTALLLFATGLAQGQTLPILDQNPTSLRWYRLTTPHFRVLYPDGIRFHRPANCQPTRKPVRTHQCLPRQTTPSDFGTAAKPDRTTATHLSRCFRAGPSFRPLPRRTPVYWVRLTGSICWPCMNTGTLFSMTRPSRGTAGCCIRCWAIRGFFCPH